MSWEQTHLNLWKRTDHLKVSKVSHGIGENKLLDFSWMVSTSSHYWKLESMSISEAQDWCDHNIGPGQQFPIEHYFSEV